MDIDFENNLLMVRSGKGGKDRALIIPEKIRKELMKHMALVKEIHDHDLSLGYGEVYLPDALDKKYPNAAKIWGWQWLFLQINSLLIHEAER